MLFKLAILETGQIKGGDDMEWVRKEGREKLNIKEKNGVVWMEFPALSETRMVSHGFSTRLGGSVKGNSPP